MQTKRLHSPRTVYTFVLPALILYTVILAVPAAQSIRMSFYRWDGLTEPVFTGLANFRKLIEDPDFSLSVMNGLKFALLISIYQIGMGSLFAFVLAGLPKGISRLFRDGFFLPVVLSVTVVCQLWLSMYNPEYGLLNRVMENLNLSFRQSWLGEADSAIWATAFVNAWQFMGFHLILLFTAVKAIPQSYFEAAVMEGAGPIRRTVSITVPLMSETYRFCLIIAATGGFKAFEQMAIMTGGGPGTSTYTLTYFMYRSAFRLNDYGSALASVTVLVAECLLFTWIINWLFEKKFVEY